MALVDVPVQEANSNSIQVRNQAQYVRLRQPDLPTLFAMVPISAAVERCCPQEIFAALVESQAHFASTSPQLQTFRYTHFQSVFPTDSLFTPTLTALQSSPPYSSPHPPPPHPSPSPCPPAAASTHHSDLSSRYHSSSVSRKPPLRSLRTHRCLRRLRCHLCFLFG